MQDFDSLTNHLIEYIKGLNGNYIDDKDVDNILDWLEDLRRMYNNIKFIV